MALHVHLHRRPARDTASWVIREKETGRVIMETFDPKKVAALNTQKYEAVPIQQYLASLNRKGRDAQTVEYKGYTIHEGAGGAWFVRKNGRHVSGMESDSLAEAKAHIDHVQGNGPRPRDAKYSTCPECEANFSTAQLVGGKLPAHKFLGKPCPGSGQTVRDRARDAIVIWALPKGETERWKEEVISSRSKTPSDVERVKAAARADGWHSFRVATIGENERPDFSKVLKKDSRDGGPPSAEQIAKWEGQAPAQLRQHPMWSAADYAYFREKGYDDGRIKEFWDRDWQARRGPVSWKRAGATDAGEPFPRGDLGLAKRFGEGYGGMGRTEAELVEKLKASGYHQMSREHQAALIGYRKMAGIRKAAGDRGRDAEALIAVKAAVEGWNYGPASHRRLLESEEYGPYPTQQAAERAAQGEAVKYAAKTVGTFRPDGRGVDHRGGPFPTVALAVRDAAAKIGSGKVKLRRTAGGGVTWDCACQKCAKGARDGLVAYKNGAYTLQTSEGKYLAHAPNWPTGSLDTSRRFDTLGQVKAYIDAQWKVLQDKRKGGTADAAGDYEVIESRRWKNIKTGATASIYGASPYTSEADKPNWKMETVGFTVRNNRMGTVGIGRQPWKTRGEAEAWVTAQEQRGR